MGMQVYPKYISSQAIHANHYVLGRNSAGFFVAFRRRLAAAFNGFFKVLGDWEQQRCALCFLHMPEALRKISHDSLHT